MKRLLLTFVISVVGTAALVIAAAALTAQESAGPAGPAGPTGSDIRVVALAPEDAKLLRETYASLKIAQAAHDAADRYVKHKYAAVLGTCETSGECHTDSMAYSKGFEHVVSWR